jgi:uncharacterized lipoprotein YbaY
MAFGNKMKRLSPWAFLAVVAVGLTAGCGHLDLVPIGEPERVLTGTVRFPEGTDLPQGAVVQVRVLDETKPGPPMVLGDQTITDPQTDPVEFKVEFNAEDDLLRLGLNIEVRVSSNGRVKYENRAGNLVTSNDVDRPHEIRVSATSQ